MKTMSRGTRWAAAVLALAADNRATLADAHALPLSAAPIVSRLNTPDPALPK